LAANWPKVMAMRAPVSASSRSRNGRQAITSSALGLRSAPSGVDGRHLTSW
jgi:hypothetical protein